MPGLIDYKLKGRYEILKLIGEGGMAAVYRARDCELEREVAVKIISEQLASAPDTRERFEQEAKTAANLAHPHILPIYDYGYDAALRRNFIVMQLVEGGTLKERLGRPLKASEVIDIVRMTADGLTHAHKRNVLHRDIKPGNILIDQGEWVFIADFGLAKLTGNSSQTSSGLIVGTPHYMSPEQCLGRSVDARTDVYSLGVVIYEMLSGHVPFQAESSTAVLLKHINEPVPPIDQPESVQQVIAKALEKEPSRRYPSCKSLADELDYALTQLAVEKAKSKVDMVKPPVLTVSMPSTFADTTSEQMVNRREAWWAVKHRLDSILEQLPLNPQIFQFYGVAGIGKTFLLRALEDLCEKNGIQRVCIDLGNFTAQPRYEAVIAIIEKLLKGLRGPDNLRDSVIESIRKYRKIDAQLKLDIFTGGQDYQAEIVNGFVHYWRTILDREPVVLLFDRTELITPEVQSWLEQLYKSQLNQRFTLILGGRYPVKWKAAGRIGTQAELVRELTPFEPADTIKHWKILAPGPIYAADYLGEFVHNGFTRGHPASNIRVSAKLQGLPVARIDDPYKTLSGLWPSIVADLADAMLDDLLGDSPDRTSLKECARALSVFLTFDRRAAKTALVSWRPDLFPEDETIIQKHLTSLMGVTVLRREQLSSLYRMQPLIRRFVADDLRINDRERYRKAHETAQNYFLARMTGADLPAFAYMLPEVLYHEAVIGKISSEARDAAPAADNDLSRKLNARLEDCLRQARLRCSSDDYQEMHEGLVDLIRDPETDLRDVLDDDSFDSLVAKLEALRSIPAAPRAEPQLPGPPVKPAPPAEAPDSPVLPRPSPLRDMLVIGGFWLVAIIVLAGVAVYAGNLTPLVLSAWLLCVVLMTIVYLAITGRLKSEQIADLLQAVIKRLPSQDGARQEEQSPKPENKKE